MGNGRLAEFLSSHLDVSRVEFVLSGLEGSDSLLRRVATSIAEYATMLTPLGEIGITAELEDAARLSRALSQRDPSTGHQPAIVVAGFPRSGTTLLQSLLSSSGHATPVGWEVTPLAVEARAEGHLVDQDACCLEVDGRYGALHAICPVVHEMHPLGAYLAEECNPLFRATGRFFPWLFMQDIPDVREMIMDDIGSASAHREWSLAMSELGPESSELVKSPLHTGYLSSLIDASPRSRVVVVRRSAESVVRSFSTLIFELQRVFLEVSSPQAAGVLALQILNALAESFRAGADREDALLTTIDYKDLLERPSEALGAARLLKAPIPTQRLADERQRPTYRRLTLEELDVRPRSIESLRELVPELVE